MGTPYAGVPPSIDLNTKLGPLLLDIRDFGAKADSVVGTPVSDNTTVIQAALNALGSATNGGVLWIPPSAKLFATKDLDVPSNVGILGHGVQSGLMRYGTLPASRALLNYTNATNCFLEKVLLEGAVTTASGLRYSDLIGVNSSPDPMVAALTENSTVWLHGGCQHFTLDRVTIQHSGGYGVLLDARTADVQNVRIARSNFLNNRPHLFGTFITTVSTSGTAVTRISGDTFPAGLLEMWINGVRYVVVSNTSTTAVLGSSAGTLASASAQNLEYGSWTGCVHYQMDGRSGATTRVRKLSIEDCSFQRNTGNCVWGHAYGFFALHERIAVNNNEFIDCGLDAILMGNVNGCTRRGNHGRRIGYVCLSDSGVGSPRWLQNVQAVFLDTSGVVKNDVCCDNTAISVNGTFCSGDGLAYSTFSGNSGRIPISTDPEYTEDNIVTCGPGGDGQNWMQGFVSGNTDGQGGGIGLTVSGNEFDNCGGTNIGLYPGQKCTVVANTCNPPAAPQQPPLALGNIGTASYQRSFQNQVYWNTINYAPASAQPAVFEDATGGAFSGTDVNYVFGNRIPTGSNAYEFQKDANTGSQTAVTFSTNYPAQSVASTHIIQRTGRASDSSSVLQWYLLEGLTSHEHMQLQGYWSSGNRGPLLNVSEGTVGGVVSTGSRTAPAWTDAMLTGKLYADDFLTLTNTTYADADADLLNNTYALLRFKSSVGYIEQSIATSGGHRVWVSLTGSAVAAGSDTWAQVNHGGVIGADANFKWDYTNQILTVTGKTGASAYHALYVTDSNAPHTAYIESDGGFLTANPNFNAIQATVGGVYATTQVEIAPNSAGAVGRLAIYLDSTVATHSPILAVDTHTTQNLVNIDLFGNVVAQGGLTANSYGGTAAVLANHAAIVIDQNGVFEGQGSLCGSYGLGAGGFNPYISGTVTNPANYYAGVGTGPSPTTVTISTTASFQVAGGSIISVTPVSDARLKTVLGRYPHGLAAIAAIHPVFYEWNADMDARMKKIHPSMSAAKGRMIGFLAQEIAAAMPEASFTNEDGYLGLDRDGILAALVVAVQEILERLPAQHPVSG